MTVLLIAARLVALADKQTVNERLLPDEYSWGTDVSVSVGLRYAASVVASF